MDLGMGSLRQSVWAAVIAVHQPVLPDDRLGEPVVRRLSGDEARGR
jgi:hypothetical protein